MSSETLPEGQYRNESFPCNPIPFANRIATLVRERGTDSIRNDQDVKACLWILMAQAYGQYGTIDLDKEWFDLYIQYEKAWANGDVV